MKAEETFIETLYDLLMNYYSIGASKSKVDKVMFQFKKAKEEFAESQNKELIKDNKYVYEALNDRRKICDQLEKEITDLKAQLNDDGEIPFVDPPVKTTRYKLTEIKKK